MKKSLILIPLAALVLAGCTIGGSKSGGGKKKKSSSVSDSAQVSGSKQSGTSTSQGGGGGGTSQTPSGKAHALPWTLTAQSMLDPSAKGYAGYEGDHDVDGTNINFVSVMVNDNPAGDSHTAESRLSVFQFSGSSSRDKGLMTISKIQAVKTVEVKALVKSSYTWNANQIGTITFGGTKVTVPGTSQSETSEYDSGWNIHTVTLNVNASSEGEFVINNTNGFAFYIISLDFKA